MSLDAFGDVAAAVRLSPAPGQDPAQATSRGLSHWTVLSGAAPATLDEMMVGILECYESRALANLTLLVPVRLAESRAALGWPLQQPAASRTPHADATVMAGLAIRPSLLIATRALTGMLGPRLIEIGPGAQKTPEPASSELREIVAAIGVAPLRRLVRSLAQTLSGAQDGPRTAELIAAIALLIERAGFDLEGVEDAIASSGSII